MLRAYALAFALALGVTVSNSFARFAYALVLPAMRSELHWSYAQAGWLNTANAIGYLTFVIAWMRDNGAGTGAVIAVWSAFGIASLAGPWLWRHPLTHWPPGRMLAGALAMVALGALRQRDVKHPGPV